MSVRPIRAETMGFVLTASTPTIALVLMGLVAQTARSTLTTVPPTLATMVESAMTLSTPSPVTAQAASLAAGVRGTIMTVPATTASMESVWMVLMTSLAGATLAMQADFVIGRLMSAR